MSWTEIQPIKVKNKRTIKTRSKTASKAIRKRTEIVNTDKQWDPSTCNVLTREPSFPGKSTSPVVSYLTNIPANNSLPTTPKLKKNSKESIEIPQFDPRIPEITTELAGMWGSEYEYISQNMTLSPLLTMTEENEKKLRVTEFGSEFSRGSYSCPGTMERGQNAFYSKRKKLSNDTTLPSITPTNNEVEFEVEFEVESNGSLAASAYDYRRTPRYDLVTVHRQIRIYNVELDDPSMNRGKTLPIGVSTYCTTPRQTECRSFYLSHCKLRCWVLVQRKTLLIRAELPDSFPMIEVEAEVSLESVAESRGVEVEALLGDVELESIAREIMAEAELIVESSEGGNMPHTGPTEFNRSATVKYESRAGLVLHLPRNGVKNNSVADAFVKSIQKITEENGVRLGVLWASGEWDGDGDLLAMSVLSAPSTDALSAIMITNEGNSIYSLISILF